MSADFDLHAAILACLDPVLETDPGTLNDWADNLELVARAFDAQGHPDLAASKRVRAADLRARSRQVTA